MRHISENELRTSLVNASVRERRELRLPDDFDALDWDRLEFLGWRDPRTPSIGYLVVDLADGLDVPADDSGAAPAQLVGLRLRAGAVPPRTRILCALCEDVSLPNDVLLFTARRVGRAGRRGDTLGTLICSHFECSRNVHRLPSSAIAGKEREMVRGMRIDNLRKRVRRFVVRAGAGETGSDGA
ncbi:FBP domain-containing protein [Gordonia aichiensis]|uniref:Elongation factor G-binding protein C-terminal treble-clef zinc-finger domain-containing protein n=1 Tax=Gordonia aichiensis NBRC 108223 TaxID=1220583 RepID=L7KQL3_9ACTN|nr:FBP domain-containing protein [Gordonia aichiensis]GAC49968.1 hypothetical protein GOACH_18_00920 [Gordonia aichiensis NBRC 108223]